MLVFYTDFGMAGAYVGQVHLAARKIALNLNLVDLCHHAPSFSPLSAAHHLAALSSQIPSGAVVVGVVDPGVGTAQRKPVAIMADGIWYVGPGNGLFDVVSQRASHVVHHEIKWRPEVLSNSFHGRDLFTPFATKLSIGEFEKSDLIEFKPQYQVSASDIEEVILVDDYGNLITGLRGTQLQDTDVIQVSNHKLVYARTFAEANHGQAFWYRNSAGLVEFAANCASAKDILGVNAGDKFTLL